MTGDRLAEDAVDQVDDLVTAVHERHTGGTSAPRRGMSTAPWHRSHRGSAGERGQVVEGAAAVVGSAAGDGDEVGGADGLEAAELRSDRRLVADDRHVRRAVGALAVEDGAVHGDL